MIGAQWHDGLLPSHTIQIPVTYNDGKCDGQQDNKTHIVHKNDALLRPVNMVSNFVCKDVSIHCIRQWNVAAEPSLATTFQHRPRSLDKQMRTNQAKWKDSVTVVTFNHTVRVPVHCARLCELYDLNGARLGFWTTSDYRVCRPFIHYYYMTWGFCLLVPNDNVWPSLSLRNFRSRAAIYREQRICMFA